MGRATSVAVQVRPGEQENADVEQEHDGHAQQERDVVREAQDAHQGQGEGQHDHESGDLRECLASVEGAAAGQAATKLPIVIEGLIPLQEHVSGVLEGPDPRGAQGRIDLEGRPSTLIRFSQHDAHGTMVRITGHGGCRSGAGGG